MGTIANLAVGITAKADKFIKGTRDASRAAKGFGKEVETLNSTVVKLGATFGAIGIGAAVKNAFSSLDQIAKTSQTIGISVEALRAWQLQADRTGVSAQQLVDGFRVFGRRLGESAAGVGEGVKGLEAIGLTAEELSRMSLDDAILTVVDALNQLDTTSQRAAAAFKIFGDSGARLVNAFAGGSAAIQTATEDLRRFGVQLDAQAIAKIEEANDSIGDLKIAFNALAEAAAVELAPAVNAAADNTGLLKAAFTGLLGAVGTTLGVKGIKGFYNALKDIGSLILKIVPAIVAGFGKITAAVAALGTFLTTTISGLIAAAGALAASLLVAGDQIRRLVQGKGTIGGAIADRVLAGSQADAYRAINVEDPRITAINLKKAKAAEAAARAAEAESKALKEAAEAAEKIRIAAEARADAFDTAIGGTDSLVTSLRDELEGIAGISPFEKATTGLLDLLKVATDVEKAEIWDRLDELQALQSTLDRARSIQARLSATDAALSSSRSDLASLLAGPRGAAGGVGAFARGTAGARRLERASRSSTARLDRWRNDLLKAGIESAQLERRQVELTEKLVETAAQVVSIPGG